MCKLVVCHQFGANLAYGSILRGAESSGSSAQCELATGALILRGRPQQSAGGVSFDICRRAAIQLRGGEFEDFGTAIAVTPCAVQDLFGSELASGHGTLTMATTLNADDIQSSKNKEASGFSGRKPGQAYQRSASWWRRRDFFITKGQDIQTLACFFKYNYILPYTT